MDKELFLCEKEKMKEKLKEKEEYYKELERYDKELEPLRKIQKRIKELELGIRRCNENINYIDSNMGFVYSDNCFLQDEDIKLWVFIEGTINDKNYHTLNDYISRKSEKIIEAERVKILYDNVINFNHFSIDKKGSNDLLKEIKEFEDGKLILISKRKNEQVDLFDLQKIRKELYNILLNLPEFDLEKAISILITNWNSREENIEDKHQLVLEKHF